MTRTKAKASAPGSPTTPGACSAIRWPPSWSSSFFTVLETVYLGPRKSLYMVRVGERTLLVSGTRERLGLLADVTDAVPPEAPTPDEGGRPRPTARFRMPQGEPEDA